MAAGYGVPDVSSRSLQHQHDTYDKTKIAIENNELSPLNLRPGHRDPNKSYYGVRIVTGAQTQAGRSNGTGVFIVLVGSKATSGRVYVGGLLAAFKGAFCSRSCDDILIESAGDLGDILVVIVGNEKTRYPWSASSPWFVDFVVVNNIQSNDTDAFPCYHWIGTNGDISSTAHTTTVKDVADNPILMYQRKNQLERRKLLYQWQKYPDLGLPSSIDDTVTKLSADEDFERVKSCDFTSVAIASVVKLGITEVFVSMKSLNGYDELAVSLGEPEIPVFQSSRWMTDVEFGRQMLNGVNPVVIRKCTALPSNFPVTTEMVKGSLNRGLTLEQEMEAGHVYICDMKMMEGLPNREGYYSTAPMCLLYVNGADQLVPIAIQLRQQPAEDNPIFLPSDHHIDWLLAKIYYQTAHTQFHQLSTHYLSCHATMEAYAMATMRNLPDPHPIYKLLRAHFRYTMAINTRARATLINKGGIIDMLFAIGGEGKEELMRRASAAYSVHWTNIKENIKERGVDDPNQLPGYHYRDDGLKVWGAMETYVRETIDLFYSCDADVTNDPELQEWAAEIHKDAFPAFREAPDGRGFPSSIQTKEELVEICTTIVFTGSAQHASVNFGQYEMYGFSPNAPVGMRHPPPTKKGVADYQFLLDSLPGKKTAALSASVAFQLSQYSQDEVFLGQFPEEHFTETKAKPIFQSFKLAMEVVAADIKERNKNLHEPYDSFLPERVPNSITI